MKKIIMMILLILFVPYIIVTLFIYNDTIKLHFKTNNFIRVKTNNEIKKINLENYILNVIASEMPASFEEEALKAQAVASRSYAMYQMNINKNKDYDVVDSVKNQVYSNDEKLKQKFGKEYDYYMNKLKKVIISTKGEYLKYNNEVINALFFSTSNGNTENVEEVFGEKLDYLQSVDSSFDKQISPSYSDEKIYEKKYFCLLLNIDCNNLKIDNIITTSTGRVNKININNKTFKGSDLASLLKLKSSTFSINIDNNIKITTKGYGHGVGMSQYGAQYLALNGKKYDEILKYYYKNIEISK